MGKFVFIDKDIPYWAGGFCAILRGSDYNTQKYIAIVLGNLKEYRNFVESFSGQNINNLKLSDLYQFKIPSPPKPIQEQIIKEIAAVEQREKAGREKVDKLKKEIEQLFSEKVYRIYSFRFSELATLEYGKSLPKNLRRNGIYPVMGSNGIDGYHDEFLVEAPCIIVGRKGSAGKVNYVNMNCYPIDTTFYIRYDKDKINIKYLYYLLLELRLEELAKGKGIGVPGLNRNNVHELKVFIANLSEQNKIIEKIDKLEAEIKAIEADLANIDNEKEQILKKHLE